MIVAPRSGAEGALQLRRHLVEGQKRSAGSRMLQLPVAHFELSEWSASPIEGKHHSTISRLDRRVAADHGLQLRQMENGGFP